MKKWDNLKNRYKVSYCSNLRLHKVILKKNVRLVVRKSDMNRPGSEKLGIPMVINID